MQQHSLFPVTPRPTAWDAEQDRRDSAKRRVLAKLQEGAATGDELADPAVGGRRFSARLEELRNDGWHIETLRLTGRHFCYKLIGGRG